MAITRSRTLAAGDPTVDVQSGRDIVICMTSTETENDRRTGEWNASDFWAVLMRQNSAASGHRPVASNVLRLRGQIVRHPPQFLLHNCGDVPPSRRGARCEFQPRQGVSASNAPSIR